MVARYERLQNEDDTASTDKARIFGLAFALEIITVHENNSIMFVLTPSNLSRFNAILIVITIKVIFLNLFRPVIDTLLSYVIYFHLSSSLFKSWNVADSLSSVRKPSSPF